MKMIMAIIKPFKLDEVRLALMENGIEGLTASEVKGFGRQKGKTENHQVSDYSVSFLPKVKLELAVNDEDVETAVTIIKDVAGTGRIGDGKIFVYDLLRAIRIRTDEEGADAL